MKKFIAFNILLCLFSCDNVSKNKSDFTTIFEKSKGTETPTYTEIISYYEKLADTYDQISLFSFGQTDSGEPLHLVIYAAEGVYNLEELTNSTKNSILINNGIHPGEPDGIDASMLLLRDIVQSDSLQKKYKNSIIAVIPVYNVGGALNRNSDSRANQNGPTAYGFRGNSRNFDLNRDFIKQDTKNAAAFAEIYHALNPDVFIDNHVSNGADYQYAISHLFTQHNKLGGRLGDFIENEMRPQIEAALQEKEILITPYVNVWGTTPEAGFEQFFDSPRYSTGYTTLFHTLGMMVETHMLKPYKTRVKQTYELLRSAIDFTEKNSDKIKALRRTAVSELLEKKTYPIAFEPAKEKPSILQFKGYEADYIPSAVTTGKRLFYDRAKPFTRPVNYYNTFVPKATINIPKAYILKKGWHNITDRLLQNNIEFTRFEKDTSLLVSQQHIADYKTRSSAYEGHYLHFDTQVSSTEKKILFTAGDMYIATAQKGVRYLLETLEAAATDSFFNWNFFDTVLQQKEGYSPYIFEDIAESTLKQNPKLKERFEKKLESDTAFMNSTKMQLDFIYRNSPHYEKAHLQLPIFKVF
jgi:hypothetical protein